MEDPAAKRGKVEPNTQAAMLKAAALAASYAEAAAAARKLATAATQNHAAPVMHMQPPYATTPISAAALAAAQLNAQKAAAMPADESAAKRSAAAAVLQMFGMAPGGMAGGMHGAAMHGPYHGRGPAPQQEPPGSRPTTEVTINNAPPRIRVALTKRSGQQVGARGWTALPRGSVAVAYSWAEKH